MKKLCYACGLLLLLIATQSLAQSVKPDSWIEGDLQVTQYNDKWPNGQPKQKKTLKNELGGKKKIVEEETIRYDEEGRVTEHSKTTIKGGVKDSWQIIYNYDQNGYGKISGGFRTVEKDGKVTRYHKNFSLPEKGREADMGYWRDAIYGSYNYYTGEFIPNENYDPAKNPQHSLFMGPSMNLELDRNRVYRMMGANLVYAFIINAQLSLLVDASFFARNPGGEKLFKTFLMGGIRIYPFSQAKADQKLNFAIHTSAGGTALLQDTKMGSVPVNFVCAAGTSVEIPLSPRTKIALRADGRKNFTVNNSAWQVNTAIGLVRKF